VSTYFKNKILAIDFFREGVILGCGLELWKWGENPPLPRSRERGRKPLELSSKA